MAELNSMQIAETEPSYGQLFAVLIRRRAWLIGVFLGVLSTAAIVTLILKPTYQSSMQLLIEPNYQSKQSAGADIPFADANVEIDNSTQLTLMRSTQMLQKALDSLKQEYPELQIKHLRKRLILTQVEDDKTKTKVFQVVYTDTDPVKAQRVLEAIQTVYLDYNRKQQELRLANGLSFINEQLPEAQGELDAAETTLEQFRKKQNLIDPTLQSKVLIETLNTVQQDRRTNLAQLRETQARYNELQQQLQRSPQNTATTARLSESTRYQTLLNEIQKIELELAKERQRFSDSSPVVKRLLAEYQEQQTLLQQETERVLGSPIPASGSRLLQQGQLGKNDLDLASQLTAAQVDLQALQAREQSLAKMEQSLNAELKQFPYLLSEYNRLQPNLEIRRETLQELLRARQELGLEIARGGFDWQVVEQPRLGDKVSPSWKKNMLLGAAAGLMLGCVAAFLRDSLDDAVHTPDELKQQVGLPLLGMVPQMPIAGTRGSRQRLHYSQSPALTAEVLQSRPFREALDLVYKNIQLLNPVSPFRSLVVTSALAGEGKTTLSLGLAMSAARLHQRVLLIDADLRHPSLHQQLELPNEWGLSTLLTSDTATIAQSMIQPLPSYGNISILTAGPVPTDPAKLLSSRRLGELMTIFEQTYDLILLDAPPVIGIVDAILAASFCNGVVLVGGIGQVTRTELTQAVTMLNKLNVIGTIANGAHYASSNSAVYQREVMLDRSLNRNSRVFDNG